VLFGPKNLPKLGSALGKTVKNVREGMEGEDEDDESTSIEKSDDSE
jgi:sec-independent protein translocase protein TatA